MSSNGIAICPTWQNFGLFLVLDNPSSLNKPLAILSIFSNLITPPAPKDSVHLPQTLTSPPSPYSLDPFLLSSRGAACSPPNLFTSHSPNSLLNLVHLVCPSLAQLLAPPSFLPALPPPAFSNLLAFQRCLHNAIRARFDSSL